MGKLGEILKHPDELVPLVSAATLFFRYVKEESFQSSCSVHVPPLQLSMYIASKRAKFLPQQSGLRFCYDMLNRVSRSFAVVIQQLPERLRDAVCVFYLVLRALDTVEDDMSIPESVKIPLLRCFHEKSHNRTWTMECGTGHYADLMSNYPLVTEVFQSLDNEYQRVIEDICKKMGNGMADFIPQEVKTIEQYNLYCHYVAGLVGIGLSQLFASSGLESKEFFKMEHLSNEMGLFLQKTNIIRDYLEDINEEPAPRMFWPKEIWGNYARRLSDFKLERNSGSAVECLNHMILNALEHAENSLEYLSRLRDPAIFRFCAIPQIMAAGTLDACFNNHDVYTSVVKMRRGETAKIFFHLKDFADVCVLFSKYASKIHAKAQANAADDPHIAEILTVCQNLEQSCMKYLQADGKENLLRAQREMTVPVSVSSRLMILCIAILYGLYAFQVDAVREYLGLPLRRDSTGVDAINKGIAGILIGYAVIVALTGRRVAQ